MSILYGQRILVRACFGAVFLLVLVGCGQTPPPPAATPSPISTVVPLEQPTVTPVTAIATAIPTITPVIATAAAIPPAATATQVPPGPTPTLAAKLQTDNFEFTIPVSEDDLDPIIPAIHNLSGVTDVQAGGNGVQVTYDPTLVTHKQIVDTIEGFGFHVKP
jgi:copper chaperone CopZ